MKTLLATAPYPAMIAALLAGLVVVIRSDRHWQTEADATKRGLDESPPKKAARRG